MHGSNNVVHDAFQINVFFIVFFLLINVSNCNSKVILYLNGTYSIKCNKIIKCKTV